jgi:hypothetical protein
MSGVVRISRDPAECTAYMLRTDNLQKSVLTPPSTLRYTLYGWTAQESADWTNFRERLESLYKLYSNPDKVGPSIRKQIKLLINEIRRYDNDKLNGHKLLNKVAVNGNVDDWRSFNVKRDTTLASDPVHHGDDVELPLPDIIVKKIGVGFHELLITNSESPGSKKKPEGIQFVKVYRYIGKVAPTSHSQYVFLDNAKIGKIISKFVNLEIVDNEKIYAWYYACYESKNGKLGRPCSSTRVEIVLNIA